MSCPEGVCPLKNTCWESAQEADFFSHNLKSISGAEKLAKSTQGGSPRRRLEVDGPSFSGGLKDLAHIFEKVGRKGTLIYKLEFL